MTVERRKERKLVCVRCEQRAVDVRRQTKSDVAGSRNWWTERVISSRK